MIPRPFILTGMLGAAATVPIVATNTTEDWQNVSLPWSSASQQPAGLPLTTPPTLTPPAASPLQHNGSVVYQSPAPLEGAIVSISDALRLDVTRQWVYSRWARKSTGLGDPELFGVRAPLVTGRQMTDIAGAISYYFDTHGVLQKLRFHGQTADTTQLIALAEQRFGMQRQSAVPGEQLYQRTSRQGIESQLRTKPAAVMWGTSPHSSFVVDLEINRRGSGRYVLQPQPQLTLPAPTTAAVTPAQIGKTEQRAATAVAQQPTAPTASTRDRSDRALADRAPRDRASAEREPAERERPNWSLFGRGRFNRKLSGSDSAADHTSLLQQTPNPLLRSD